MRGVLADPDGSLPAIRVTDLPAADPEPDQYLIRIHACSLNYRDILVARGEYGGVSLPVIPGSDAVGEIASAGARVDPNRVGERVALTALPNWMDGSLSADSTLDMRGGAAPGVLREFCCARASELVALPDYLTWDEAAALPVAGLTAWHALFESGRLKPGQTVVLQGTGGVSLFALQFARAAGARCIITSSSDAKLARAADLGAHAGINYRSHPDWPTEVKKHSPGGADYVVDVGGGATLADSIRALRYGGCVLSVGRLSGLDASISLGPFYPQGKSIAGVFCGSRRMFVDMCAALEVNKIHPIIDSVWTLESAAKAFARLASGEHFGKVIVRVQAAAGD